MKNRMVGGTESGPSSEPGRALPLNNIKYDYRITVGLIITGILIKIFFNTDEDFASSTIWGYGLIVVSLFLQLFLGIGAADRQAKKSGEGMKASIGGLKGATGIIGLIILLVWIIGININYYGRINDSDVSDEYYRYSSISTMLIILQLFYVLHSVNQSLSNTEETSGNPLVILLTLLNVAFVGIMHIILQYYTTDG